MVNCILQGKGRAASAELTRFLINSTVGVLGFGNPAKRWSELSPKAEDLGQTLATYGIGDGFYIVWPILGPSTLRDSVGRVGDWFLNPVSYVHPTEAYLGIRATETVNETSFRIGDYESLKEAAIDPYVAFRNAYIQHRKKKVKE
jgi:phospholipid-binding lipoprotein MlaA